MSSPFCINDVQKLISLYLCKEIRVMLLHDGINFFFHGVIHGVSPGNNLLCELVSCPSFICRSLQRQRLDRDAQIVLSKHLAFFVCACAAHHSG